MSPFLNSRTTWLAAFGAAVLVLTGCASNTRVEPPAPVENRLAGAGTAPTVAPNANAGATTGQAAQSTVTPVDVTRNDAAANAGGRVVYFDFDSYVVKDEYRGVVESNARRLSADRKRRVLIEGHTDERGGHEYNLALGQRRAEAVLKSLTLLGVSDAQLEAVSFGKEKPAVAGSNEAAWAKNRRAELKDR
ncbi:peptidoglycan-associated lipoprotein Pal [Sphaerotilus montanus]|jgi:peptidoglycan-associated lipoprotein|uniref:peptidoglycan-associated lipoprotein Pal n=1 Tax=Sphaerotilus montanus TaxID=522889 RepID=UPI001B3FA0F5|nr:peptidoglycan-associated lipoprotein Pal [Sphaerotilus sp.]